MSALSPIVVAELKFGDVQRKIFGADFVKCADNAALEDRPEAFNRVRVDDAVDVLALGVIDHTVREIHAELAIAATGRCRSG
jgi:hypothetical protein